MSLTLIQIPLAPPALHRWAQARFWAGGDLDEGRALHHLLSECFGKGALQPFRLMVGQGGRQGNLYAYTDQSAEALAEMARAIAPPDALAVIDPAALRAKLMPAFRVGQRLGFDVKLWPMRRIRTPLGQFKPGAELDVYLVAKLRGGNLPDRQAVYLDWLAERLEGATLDVAASSLAGMVPRRLHRKGNVTGTEITVHGTLEITDPGAFSARMARGVARHSAYGFGMLMLRAPQAPIPGA